MGLPEDATSEWVTRDGTRYAASPEDVARAVPGGLTFAVHDFDKTSVDAGCCTQVLLRKARDGTYTLLLNGRASEPQNGVHTLPPFREDQLIREEATGREAPAPVAVSLLVEKGACAPDVVRLQVLQRKFAAGIQVDEGRETVAMEERVPPTRPGDVESQAVLVAYPMTIGPSPKLVLRDNARARALSEKYTKEFWKSAIGTTTAAASGTTIQSPLSVFLSNTKGKVLGAAATALAVAVNVYLTIGSMATKSTMLAVTTSAAAVLNAAYQGFATKRASTDEELVEETTDTVTRISIFDLPALLRRLTGRQTGGLYSNLGQTFTLEELRKNGRSDDAAVLTWLAFAHPLNPEQLEGVIAVMQEGMEAYLLDQFGKKKGDALSPAEEAQMKEAKENVAAGVNKSNQGLKGIRDGYEFTGLDLSEIKKGSYVETVLRLEVIDARRNGASAHETFTLVSHVSRNAGLLASGYRQLYTELKEVVEQSVATLNAFDEQAAASPVFRHIRPLVESQQPRVPTLGKKLFQLVSGTGRDVYLPAMKQIAAQIQEMGSKLEKLLTPLAKKLDALPPPDPLPPTIRYLPHVVRARNRSGLTFVLDRDDEAVDIAASADPAANNSSDLRDALAVSSTTIRIVRQAAAQFIERDGVLRPRMQTQLVLGDDVFSSTDNSFRKRWRVLPKRDAGDARGIHTRHVYAPRMPLAVVGAMACRAEHGRVREGVAIGWLLAGAEGSEQVGVAKSFGLPPSHLGELVMGMVADLATDDALDRAQEPAYRSVRRSQLMANSVHAAIDRLALAHTLAVAVLRKNDTVHPRLQEHDAVFECYPEGDTLRKLLHESAVWREWMPPSYTGGCNNDLKRRDAGLASALATPMGLDTVGQLLKAIGSLKHSNVRLTNLPFLAPQTLAHCTDSQGGKANGALVVHVAHAYSAAQRLHVLANGLGLQDHVRFALLCECALARPVLDLLSSDSPAPDADALRVFTQPIDPEADGASPAQTGAPPVPRQSALLDNLGVPRKWLSARLASMRLDLDELEKQRVLSGDLADAFAELGLDGSVQYLVPFGDTIAQEHSLLLTPFFEDAPTYVELLQRVPAPADANVVTVRPRHAHEEDGDLHPYVITADGAVLSAAMVHIPPVDWVDTKGAVPTTLEEATEAARVARAMPPFVLGLGVDASAAFVFNVERLVQCALIVGTPALLRADPPAPPKPRLVPIPDDPSEPEALRRARFRVWVLRIATSEAGIKWLSSTLASVEKEPDTLYSDVATLLDPLTEKAVATIMERMDITDPAGDLYAMLEEYVDKTQAVSAATSTSNAWEVRFAYFDQVLKTAEKAHEKHKTDHENEWAPKVEEKKLLAEKARRDGEAARFLWPAVVAVANALVRSMLVSPPTLVVGGDAGDALLKNGTAAFDAAVQKWKDAKLAVVPLCEVSATVIGMAVA